MFYSQFILAKKGPLGTIWIAAHLERKLRKNQVAETDIGVTVDSILFPEVPIALRLSGHLLLGVVRIYSRQVNYLFNDCSETLGKIKQAFHSAAVDLPPEATTAPFHTITLPETFDFDELELVPDSESSFLHLNGNFVDQHVTTREQITLQDTVDHNPYLGSSQFGLDERFGDGGYFSLGLDFDEDFLADKTPSSPGASTPMPLPKEDMTVPPSGNESTLTPLLKEDAAGPSMGCENEVTPMETDDHCEPVKSGCYEVDLLGERAKAVLGSPERDNRPNTSAQAIAVDPLIEHADSQVTLRKELDFAYSKHDTPGFYAYTPRALEACTPDLNQEYCPPDEPSTPALVDETSLPMYKEFTVENAGRFSPAFTGHFERIATSETLQGSLPPHQVQNPWASSTKEAIRSPSSASFQGFTLHQAGPVDQINGVWSTQSENAQICLLKENAAAVTSVVENAQGSSVKENAAAVTSVVENAQVSSGKENAAAVYTAFPSFPQQACLQQHRTDVRHEVPKFPGNASDSFLKSCGASLPQSVGIAFPSFPQQACLQQGRTDVRHEASKFPANASDSFLISSGASLPQSCGTAFPSFPQQACLQQGRTDIRDEGPKFSANASDSFLISSGASLPQSCGNAFPSFPQQACLQQGRTDIRDEGPKFSANASDSFLISSGASLPQSVGTSSTFVNSQWGDSLNQVVSAPFQQQGLSVGPYSPQTLVGVGTEPPGFQPPSTLSTTTVGQYSPQTLVGVGTETPGFQPPSSLLNTMTGGQGSMASFASPTSINPSLFASTGSMASFASPTSINPSLFASTGSMASFASPTCINTSLFASTGSYLPMENVPPSRHMEHMGMGENLAATKGSLWQPAAQQCNASSFAVNAPLMSRMGMEECETLRSAYNLEDRSANFSLLQQGMSHDRMPGLELDRNNFCSPSIEGAAKELLLPESYRTPVLRDETPFTVARTSVLSAPNLNSVPGDDDVLASILGRRTKVFKVISTPKAQRPPKASAASKRPKLPSRATPKRRKVELDTVAVLHGDVIRQQLANTEDIHRERRKAPCTRRAVWGFLRECEGQENFDEPTLPEFSSDLLELYHDVVHGRESRPRSLIGATEVKEASLEALKDDCSELDHAEDSDLLAHYVKRISMKDACPSQVVGITENLLPENIAEQVFTNEDACLYQAVDNVKNGSLDKCLEQPKEDREEETAAQQNLVEGLMGAGDAETLRAEEPSALEVGTEVLDGKEGQAFLFPDAQVAEDASSKGVTETKTEEQGAQPSELERELETLLDSGFPDSVLSKEVVDQGVAVIVQQDTVCIEEQNQPSVGLDKQASREGQIVSSSEDANLQALCIPSGGKDAAEMPVFQAAGMDIGNAEEGEDKTTTSVVFEEETHQNRHDEEMADAEPERDTDCLDEDNDVAYAEIDYSSDEQDVSIQDDSGWSTRSRNVGKYLKTVFQEMESSSKRLDQGATLGLERLLARRTRREAARMFFETLVLKTKDYIHVEQNVAYQDILLYPNSKLMKTEF